MELRTEKNIFPPQFVQNHKNNKDKKTIFIFSKIASVLLPYL